ncbi:MAG: T9SS type A sorting domain-containing protein [bacterium]|nr:T9SS type A sorting domain-containing protein [bacterium]
MRKTVLPIMVAVLFFQTGISAQNLLSAPESVVYDSIYSRYLASNYNTGHIVAIDLEGNQSYFVQNQYCRNGLHIEGNVVYAACIDQGVKGFDLGTGDMVMHVNIPWMINLNDITSDTSGNLYISDVYASMIYKIHLADQSYSIFVDCGTTPPNGLYYDRPNNRLLVATYTPSGSPIQAVSLVDSSVTNLVNTGFQYLDGITQDNNGDYYFTTWQTRSVYRYDSLFSNTPVWVYSNGGGPADLFFNKVLDVLVVPVMGTNHIEYISVPTAVDGGETGFGPVGFKLFDPYPNPFNPTTTISYQLPAKSQVKLEVFDVSGRLVTTLINGWREAGTHEVTFDGSGLAAGVYVYHLRAGEYTGVQKLILLK